MSKTTQAIYLKEIETAAGLLASASLGLAELALSEALARRGRPGGAQSGRGKTASPKSRRSPEEMTRLAESLMAAVQESPGLSMAELASIVGTSPISLKPVVARLKQENRLRKVGAAANTRYFPASGSEAA